jgi:hypothetical protein
MPEIGTSGSMSGDGKRGAGHEPSLPRPSSTLPPGAKRMPPPPACFVVAVLLAGVAAWPLLAAGLIPEAWPRWLTLLAGAGMAAVFAGRGVAGYTQAWRRYFPEQPFAAYERHYYSPLCLALGAGYLGVVVVAGTTP